MIIARKYFQKFKVFGFSGPRYGGLSGKIRLIVQELFFHREVIFIATPDFFKGNNVKINQDVSIRVISSYQDCKKHIQAFEDAYYICYADSWPHNFDVGEKLVLAFLGDRVAGFAWLQFGTTVKGAYYIRLLKDECRTYREGVFPAYRGKKIYSTMKFQILKYLFSNGINRVYVDAYKDNSPSCKAQMNAGFRPFGEIVVLNIPFFSWKFIHWI